MPTSYQPEKGTENLMHVRVTKKNGQQLAEPKIEHYAPEAWTNVAKLPGYEAEVVHDPRKSDQKSAKVSTSTVKSSEKLSEPEQYEQRYKELFKSSLPDELVGSPDRVKLIVDRAEAKLKEALDGEKPVNELLYEGPKPGQLVDAVTAGAADVTPGESNAVAGTERAESPARTPKK